MDRRDIHVFRFIVLFITVEQFVWCGDGPKVTIGDTEYIGKYGEADFRGTSKPFKMFKGIPYAKPPVGELRFKKPERLNKPLHSPFMATQYSAACNQPAAPKFFSFMKPMKLSEDSLYLNVFVPEDKPDKDTGHAVMVYIHGGAFKLGCGEPGGQYPATFGNVIVVSINYRLGIFGFLGSQDKSAPGNLGLWDQHLALQWINKNIGAFGGDNKRVTIFGESAGSVSVLLQALYPGNNGLFQRVIAESGTPALRILFSYTTIDSLKRYARLAGCTSESPKNHIVCLQEKPASELIAIMDEIVAKESLAAIKLLPYLDNDFITIDPFKLDTVDDTKSEAIQFYRTLDIINGMNSHEGLTLYKPDYLPVIDNPITFKPTRHQMESQAIPSVLATHYTDPTLDGNLIKMVSAQYTDWSDPDNAEHLRDELIKLIGDLTMIIPAIQLSRLHVNTTGATNSYMYYFAATPSNPIVLPFPWARGANHLEELAFVFFFHRYEERIPTNDWEYELSYDVMTYWTNFAKTGNPNKPKRVKVDWSKYEMKEQRYLELNKDMVPDYSQKYFYAEEANFWLNTLPSVRNLLNSLKNEFIAQGTCSAYGECP